MSEEAVVSVVKQGATEATAPRQGGETAGSRWLVERANAEDPEGAGRPLWVLVWGSLTDLAQALHNDPGIAPRIRIYYIGSSNTTNDPESLDYMFRFMADSYADVWWIENGIMPRLSHDTFRGYYLGGDQSGVWGNRAFIEQVIRGRGTRHGGMFADRLGDAFPVAEWPDGVLKEGDSPSFLYLLSPVVGGVGDVNDPAVESWGGRFRRPGPERYPNYWVDLDAPAEECQGTISRWRVDYLSDWKRRWVRYG